MALLLAWVQVALCKHLFNGISGVNQEATPQMRSILKALLMVKRPNGSRDLGVSPSQAIPKLVAAVPDWTMAGGIGNAPQPD